MKQANITYKGRVQGVGFRYTTNSIAQKIEGVTGWVKNQADGSVAICAQGDEASISKLCAAIEREFEGNISNKEIIFTEVANQLNTFTVTY